MKYLRLIKPNIVLANLISSSGGFFFASKGIINYSLLFLTLISIGLIISSGCIFNNYIDQDIDKRMRRTRYRILAKEKVSRKKVIIFGVILGILGFFLLYLLTISNLLSFYLAIFGFFIYVGIYSLYMKRKSSCSVFIGSISGAIPPIISYCVVSHRLTFEAYILFLIFIFWQIPHFYSIAIFRIEDYISASIPILPIEKSVLLTKIRIIFYILIFSLLDSTLSIFGYTGKKHLLFSTIINIYWLFFSMKGMKKNNLDKPWSKKMFLISVFSILISSITISIDYKLH